MLSGSAAPNTIDQAELRLLRQVMNATLGDEGRVESLAVDHQAGVVNAEVRLPEGITERESADRRVAVQTRLDVLVAAAFGDEGLALTPVVFVDGGLAARG